MQTLTPILDRLLTHLAHELGYSLSADEKQTYLAQLSEFSFETIVEGILRIRDDGRPYGTFPPVSEFRRVLSRVGSYEPEPQAKITTGNWEFLP